MRLLSEHYDKVIQIIFRIFLDDVLKDLEKIWIVKYDISIVEIASFFSDFHRRL